MTNLKKFRLNFSRYESHDVYAGIKKFSDKNPEKKSQKGAIEPQKKIVSFERYGIYH